MSNQLPVVLALDAGTTSVRCIAFDPLGNISHQASRSIELAFPQPGWVETDANIIWYRLYDCLIETWNKLGQNRSNVIGIGLANQRETIVAWHSVTGEPLYPAISWQDRRTTNRCRVLKAQDNELWFSKSTGLTYDPYFSCSKIEWILEHVDEVRRAKELNTLRIGTIDTWLVWKLTGGQVYCTDPTNASRTGLFNIVSLKWDKDLIDHWNIKDICLPEIIQNDKSIKKTEISEISNLPLLAIMGDQQASAYGHNCQRAGQAKNTFGTGCFLVYCIGEKPLYSQNGLITTISYLKSDSAFYAFEGSVFAAGSLVEWMIRNKWIDKNEGLRQITLRSGQAKQSLYFVPALTGLGAPYWDPQARGTILGIDLDTSIEDLVTAAINSIAFQVDDLIQTIETETKTKIIELLVDGGLSQLQQLMQLQADLSDVVVLKSSIIETTAWGVAKLAFENHGMQVNHSSDNFYTEIFKPSMSELHRKRFRYDWSRAVQRSLNWLRDCNEYNSYHA